MSHSSDADILITDIDFYSLSRMYDPIQGAHIVSDALEPPGSKTPIELCLEENKEHICVFLEQTKTDG